MLQMLMAPKPNRLLLSETVLPAPELAYYNEHAGQRKSFKRLSDILNRSEHHDIWIVYVCVSQLAHHSFGDCMHRAQ